MPPQLANAVCSKGVWAVQGVGRPERALEDALRGWGGGGAAPGWVPLWGPICGCSFRLQTAFTVCRCVARVGGVVQGGVMPSRRPWGCIEGWGGGRGVPRCTSHGGGQPRAIIIIIIVTQDIRPSVGSGGRRVIG